MKSKAKDWAENFRKRPELRLHDDVSCEVSDLGNLFIRQRHIAGLTHWVEIRAEQALAFATWIQHVFGEQEKP